jgi:hypothetical protein
MARKYNIHSRASINLTPPQEAAKFPDWGKVQFYEYPEEHWGKLLPRVSEEGQDLISELVRYESGARTTALKVSIYIPSHETPD